MYHRDPVEESALMKDIMLRVQGTQLVRGSGTPVVLRGVGLGGWMNMENFITGYPANESQQRAALRDALGETGYRRFFDRFLHAFFDDEDARFLASIGVNCFRLPLNYRHFEDDDRPFELKDEGFRTLDRAIESCARHQIYTVLDLHALPGFQNQHWHSDNPTHWAQFWTHRHFQDRTVHLWEALAERYRDHAWVAGHNPTNQPAGPPGPRAASRRPPAPPPRTTPRPPASSTAAAIRGPRAASTSIAPSSSAASWPAP